MDDEDERQQAVGWLEEVGYAVLAVAVAAVAIYGYSWLVRVNTLIVWVVGAAMVLTVIGLAGRFDPSYAVDFWDITNRQDWAACESVQRGMANPGYVPGPMAPREDGVFDFVNYVARKYSGE